MSANETIATAIYDEVNGSGAGRFSVEVEIDENTVVEVSGHSEIEGYCEDDYFNGTGAWVTTYAAVSIDTLEAYNEDGEPVEIDCDTWEIERAAADALRW